MVPAARPVLTDAPRQNNPANKDWLRLSRLPAYAGPESGPGGIWSLLNRSRPAGGVLPYIGRIGLTRHYI
jgi:hypothetical protein